jgi:hypothetical protein
MVMFMIQTSLFIRFKESYPEAQIQERYFVNQKPFYVRALKVRNVCCCRYHVELDMLREGLNTLRSVKGGVHSHAQCRCNCEICRGEDDDDGFENCKAHRTTFTGTMALWRAIVCDKMDDDLWHQYDCLMGLCGECGVSKLKFCQSELQAPEDFILNWKCFEKTIVGQGEDGQPKKRIREVFKKTSVPEFLDYFLPNLTKFVTHNFVARWQDSQCQNAMSDLPADMILSHIDFAENHSFQIQNEIQSMHWFFHQVTILVHLTYRRNPSPDDDEEWIKESHFYISDDKEHDVGARILIFFALDIQLALKPEV